MRYGRKNTCIIIMTLLVLILALFAWQIQTESAYGNDSDESFSFLVNGTERIKSWESSPGEFYVFLPGYADMRHISFISDEDETVSLGDRQIHNGMTLEAFVPGQAYNLQYEHSNVKHEGNLTFLRSENIPSVHIDVESGSMDYIHLEKGNEENGEIRLYESDGRMTYSSLMKIKGRGNTSWDAEKKPYHMILDQEADLLGMGTAGNWVLLSEGYNHLAIRNKVVYDFARAAGLNYSPECRWIDLYLNGEYAGLYELSEKNEIHPARVDISQENGGFLVSMEYESRLREQKIPYVLTHAGQALRVRSETAELNAIQQRWQMAENAILSQNGIDPESGKHWSDLIDLDSWARKYVIEEVFGNMDAGSLSQFFYVDGSDPEGQIFAGPVWDYDFSMGGEDHWLKPYTDYFVMNRTYVNDEVFTPWFPSLYQQEEFLNRVKELYMLEYLPLLQELITNGIQNEWEVIQAAAAMDAVRWDREWSAVQQEPAYMQSFLEKRMAFLSDMWINETKYHVVSVDPGRYGLYGCFAVKEGDTLPDLPTAEALGGLGWYLADSDTPFDVSQPIYEDLHIYMKKPETKLPVIHLVPVAGMMAMMAGLIVVGSYREKKNRSAVHESAQVK